MSKNLSGLPDEQLRELSRASRQVIISLPESLEAGPDMQNAIGRLMRRD